MNRGILKGRFSILWMSVIGLWYVGCASAQPEDTLLPPLREQIAKMLVVGFRGVGPELTPEMREAVEEVGVAGVILFELDGITKTRPRNILSKEQVIALNANLKAASATPLLVMIDQEGGFVNRLKERYGYPRTVTAKYIGELDNPDTTAFYADRIAEMVASSGFNFNGAPCVDLNVNPDCPVIGKMERSFSADPAVVTRMAATFYQAQKRRGVLSSYKHFPGHGSSAADSHLGFTDVSQTWSEQELEPYKQLIASGQCDIIMTSHVFNKQLDADYPATLSQKIITGLLRGQLGYRGVVISDDMAMQAITDHWTQEEALEKGINAGIDLFILSNQAPPYNEHAAKQAVDIIEKLVKEHKITAERIAESYRRIVALQARL